VALLTGPARKPSRADDTESLFKRVVLQLTRRIAAHGRPKTAPSQKTHKTFIFG
jgi:hypothetical protein